MGRLFGTDGIRGIANTELSCEIAMDIAKATAVVVAEEIGRPPTFLVGTDTRISAGMLEAAVNTGLCSVGSNVVNVGVVPTPAVAYLVTEGYADVGIMISASHNSFEFNGIKIFGTSGFKLTDDQEFEIEKIVLDKVLPYPVKWGKDIGHSIDGKHLVDHYIDHIASSLNGNQDLSNLKVALDCSNGSASRTARKLFTKFGVNIEMFNCKPNGININKNCGSTHIDVISDIVKSNGFDLGFAFDGDADRCLMVDENGNLVDGDVILAILALDLRERGKLEKDTFVATVMSNIGLFKFAEKNNFNIETTKVGDRYVLENMSENGYVLGGEQSGHIILSEYMSTGDGQLTAIKLLNALKRKGGTASELASVMKVYPQALKNIRADSTMKSMLDVYEGVQNIIKKAEDQLGDEGRVLIRPSGTEPVIRIMAEGPEQSVVDELVSNLSAALEERLTLKESYKPLSKE